MKKTATIVLTMARRINANSTDVFKAWTKPELMKKWLFTTEATNVVAKNDLRVGGKWEIVDRREGEEYRATGEYLEIDAPHRLGFTFEMPQFNDLQDQVIVWVSPVGQACEMTFKQEIVVPHEESWGPEDIQQAMKEYSEQSEEGWDKMFEGLKQLVETGDVTPSDNK
ncbi:SRPBCC family protein [Planomicrobium okeanokoites]|uniref:SRPBCC domain-containing protein n=1 Tax=Planomicrobium okeanokoites TaxID=244 RepID=A0ABV7KJW9_PLAOK|nr:SRPBCC domain-containing protein [Planomicrobium okeanokoites]TAA69029.1 SRPBCC domain-containing protein [Planomicrobium okeanokoites]